MAPKGRGSPIATVADSATERPGIATDAAFFVPFTDGPGLAPGKAKAADRVPRPAPTDRQPGEPRGFQFGKMAFLHPSGR